LGLVAKSANGVGQFQFAQMNQMLRSWFNAPDVECFSRINKRETLREICRMCVAEREQYLGKVGAFLKEVEVTRAMQVCHSGDNLPLD
jgi:hypothetical protein